MGKKDAVAIEMCDEVECTVTGFKGTVVAITTYMNGCRRMDVRPPVDKEGKMRDGYMIDEHQLKVTKKANPPHENKSPKTGGPMERVRP